MYRDIYKSAHELYDLGLNSQEYSDEASKCSLRTVNEQMWYTVNKFKKLSFAPTLSLHEAMAS